ncbi:putative iSBma2, transposase [Burkholderia mallei]|uniref:hypothetical protein n=1 Tax=Burkholderia mallei TaxID=13373 RepID=UPI0006C597C5|nr:hypothetical protein [Burkholderia mallei]KOS91410.1 putative iSBma2, transposase [Burkholderia mallei]
MRQRSRRTPPTLHGTTVYQEIFDEIVRQAIKRGLVDGRVLYTDSTHLKRTRKRASSMW